MGALEPINFGENRPINGKKKGQTRNLGQIGVKTGGYNLPIRSIKCYPNPGNKIKNLPLYHINIFTFGDIIKKQTRKL